MCYDVIFRNIFALKYYIYCVVKTTPLSPETSLSKAN